MLANRVDADDVLADAGAIAIDGALGFALPEEPLLSAPSLTDLTRGPRTSYAFVSRAAGDLDPAEHAHLHRQPGWSRDDIDRALNMESGLKVLAGVNDFRRLSELREEWEIARQALPVIP